MNKILLFAGTTEGRRLAEFLNRYQIPAYVCVATDYGGSLLPESPCLQIQASRLDAGEISALIKQEGIGLVVDATHPYAAVVSENIKKACQSTGREYLRLLRGQQQVQAECIWLDSMEAAVDYLSATTGNILATTGSKELDKFTGLAGYQERLYARVLANEESVAAARRAGIAGSHLICMQGPFSEALNTAMMKQIKAKWMVTKDSGSPGGFAEKVSSAKAAGAKLIVIRRPVEEGKAAVSHKPEEEGKAAIGHKPEEEGKTIGNANIEAEAKTGWFAMQIRHILCKRYQIQTNREISLIGIGMGSREGMTREAENACENAQIFIGAARMLETVQALHKPVFVSYRAAEIKQFVREHPEYEKIAVLLSGDVGFYSGAKELRQIFAKENLHIYPGISSVAYLCAKAGVSWEDVKLLSLHGRSQNIISACRQFSKVFALIGGSNEISRLCRKFVYYGLSEIRLTVGVQLSYPQERIVTASARELQGQSFDSLCAVLICNDQASPTPVHGLPDDSFIRGRVPMTKAEVRSISIAKLRLSRGAVAYDVGAGTGSVAIEMALQAWDGQIYAIEKNPEAIKLLEENKRRFACDHLTIIAGLAPEALTNLPAPTHVFVGGSAGNLLEILSLVLHKNPRVHIVINAITLETVLEALQCFQQLPVVHTDIAAISAAKAKEVGKYHMMMGQNPVYIISCMGGCADE